jgi:hypothetical protein
MRRQSLSPDISHLPLIDWCRRRRALPHEWRVLIIIVPPNQQIALTKAGSVELQRATRFHEIVLEVGSATGSDGALDVRSWRAVVVAVVGHGEVAPVLNVGACREDGGKEGGYSHKTVGKTHCGCSESMMEKVRERVKEESE